MKPRQANSTPKLVYLNDHVPRSTIRGKPRIFGPMRGVIFYLVLKKEIENFLIGIFTNAPATKPVRKSDLIRSDEFPLKFKLDTLTPVLMPNEVFCLSADWALAGNEIMKYTDVSKSKNFLIAA